MLCCCSVGRVRLLETTDLNLTQAAYVQFTIQVGSTQTGCPRPSDSTENIFLQYSTNGGVTWTVLQTIAYNSATSPSTKVVSLPNVARVASGRVRWYQPRASGSGFDAWAIDDVYIDFVHSILPVTETFDPTE